MSYGFTATAQTATDTINLTWTSEPAYTTGTNSVQVWYKTASWHLLDTIDFGWLYYNDIAATDDYTYQFKLIFVRTGYANIETDTVSCTRWTNSSSEAITATATGSSTTSKVATSTDTITLTASGTVSGDLSGTSTDTIKIADSTSDLATVSLDVDYQYYFGSYNGELYRESEILKSDAGEDITCWVITKTTDFADQMEQAFSKFKTVYGARLWYVDVASGTLVNLEVSTDGGDSWVSYSKTVGTGDETMKCVDFYFVKTAHTFKFRLSNDTHTDRFQWTALEIKFEIGGDYFAI